MKTQNTFDEELRLLLDMLNFHNVADENVKDGFVSDISDWFDNNAVYLTALDMGLHQEINHILEDGIITDEEQDTLTHYILDYLDTHKHFDYVTYKKDKQRLTRQEIENIEPYPVSDKDFIGKTVVITGAFDRFPVRKNAELEIRRRGGKTSQSISSVTNMVICGNSGVGWRKIEDVKVRNKQGQNIRLVNEETFYKMLESNEAVEE